MKTPQEKICGTSEKSPAQRLAAGASASADVFAQNCWNAHGIKVKQGERYQISASGKWMDKSYEANANGYASPNRWMAAGEKMRRVEDRNWFYLIACIHPDPALDAHNPKNMLDGIFKILVRGLGKFDKASQLTCVGADGTLDVNKDGYLYFFANDALWAYSNNSGYLTVTVTKVG